VTASDKRICVFAGSSPGRQPQYVEAAQQLGEELCARGYDLVYGGGRVGLMGTVADSVLGHGGQVIGVIPEGLAEKEVAHRGLTDLRVVTSMHERKALMAELSTAFIALPGGLGTLEELFEVLTWVQLGIHTKPCGLVNVGGYFNGLLEFISHAVEERFLKPDHQSMILVDSDIKALLDAVEAFVPPAVEKWLDRDQI
jgi:uncharacterized protein (TIGR00730 family)